MSSGTPSLDTLLAQGAWLRNLARRLASGADADDVAQETWRAAIESPPDPDRPLRPWLAQVLRNTVRTAFRRSGRRRARERAVSAIEPAPPTAEDALARAQLHQRLAQLVAELDDPYRATVVARFYEGLEAAEIARRSGVPAGTVRWRLSEGIRRLRAGLDEAHGGDRRRWSALLLLDERGPVRDMRLFRWPATKIGLALLITATAGLGTGLVAWRLVARPAPAPLAGIDRESSLNQKEDPMDSRSRKAAALVGAALPVLVAASQAQAALADEAVNWCVEMREKVFACQDEFADAFVARRHPPPEQQMALVAQALEEIRQEGSGPLPPRRERCRQWVARRLEEEPGGDREAKLAAVKKLLAFCSAKEDCKARVECLLPFLGPPPAPPGPAEKTWERLGGGRAIGRVIDAGSGAPMAGVEVRVLAMTTQRKLTPRHTDAAGAFTVDGLPDGEPVKLVLIADRKTHVIERRLLAKPQPSIDTGTLRLQPGNMEARSREGSWRGYTGIFASEDESATVARVGPGTPADRAGVRSGDRILTVDGKDVRGLPFGGLEWHLRGRPGTSAVLVIQSAGAPPRPVTLARIPD